MEANTFIRRVVGVGLALSIGASAFAGEASAKDARKPKPHDTESTTKIDITVTNLYTSDGKRITKYHDSQNDNDDMIAYGIADTIAYCDGRDLVDVTRSTYDTTGSLKSRSAGHPACNDGRLEPSDFPKNPGL